MSSEDESAPSGDTKRKQGHYKTFQKWNKLKGATPVSQDVLLKFFSEVAERSKPTTLWAYHSMLKTSFKLNDDIDITPWSKILDFIKIKNAGYKSEKAKLFTEEEIEKFINEAPDDEWLDVKVVCIFGVNGVYRLKNLVHVRMEHIKQYDDMFLVSIPKSKTNSAMTTFTVSGKFFTIVQCYASLRPHNVKDNRFFLQYKDEKCSAIPIGKAKFIGMPGKIAKYLKLPELGHYSGLSFRIPNLANLATSTGGYNSISVPEPEQDVGCSLDCETGLIKTPSVSRSCTKESVANNVNAAEHICILSCGEVKCALGENENSALHAFSILKPPDYDITEITPALFGSDPICRWICAYTHVREPVSSSNADETFVDITRSIPSNVKIYQQYIRGNSHQYKAAYVVEYGVNCGCQKEILDLFNFTVN